MSYALGIDVGTTFTAAAVHRDGAGSIVQLGTHRAAVPSVVVFRGDDTVLTGDAAERRSRTEPDRVAREFKRRFGDETPMFVGGSPRSPEMITSRLLRDVFDYVVEREGGPPTDGVAITHPAAWGEYKLGVLREAVRLAGLSDVTYVAEPIAAAVHYSSLERVPDGAVIGVYDLGGGTFDAAAVASRGDTFQILGRPEGIERLGGVDFDAAVLQHVRTELGDVLDELDPTGIEAIRLRNDCVAAKEALSTDSDTTIAVLVNGREHEVRLTRGEFEDMIRPVLATSIEAMRRALDSAGLSVDQLHAVLLVGGGSRIPLVAEMVAHELGRPVAVDVHPKHSIALGAARFVAGATSPALAPPVVPPPVAPTEPTSDSRRRRWPLAAAVLALVVAAGVLAVFVFAGDGDGDTATTSPATAATPPPTDEPDTTPPTTEPTPTDPATTPAPPTDPPTTPPPPTTVPGDLGLEVAMTQPDCDGQSITVLFSAIDPANYEQQISDQLNFYDDSAYLRTASTCPSLRGQFTDGSDIYVVYYGPFPTTEQACAERSGGPPDAYVKTLSLDLPFDHEVSCG